MSKKHSSIGASSADRWMNCPGSVHLNKTIKKPDGSSYASEGTFAHALAEKSLIAMKPLAYRAIGKELTLDDVTMAISEDMVDAVNVYFNYVQSLMKPSKHFPEPKLHIEKSVCLRSSKDAFGTADAIVESVCTLNGKKRIEVVDFKFGKGKRVSAENNKQLLYYALGAMNTLKVDFDKLSGVGLSIVQPRVSGDVDKFEVIDYELKAFEAEVAKAIATVRRQKEGSLDLKPGKWCHSSFCPARGVCKALCNDAHDKAFMAFSTVAKPTMPSHPCGTMDPIEVSAALKNVPYIEQWVKELRTYALELANSGVQLPGFVLLPRRANRKWTSEDDVVETLTPLGIELYEAPKLKSPAQIEKSIPKGSDIDISSLYHTPNSGMHLVLEADIRDTEVIKDVFSEYESCPV